MTLSPLSPVTRMRLADSFGKWVLLPLPTVCVSYSRGRSLKRWVASKMVNGLDTRKRPKASALGPSATLMDEVVGDGGNAVIFIV